MKCGIYLIQQYPSIKKADPPCAGGPAWNSVPAISLMLLGQ